MLCMSPRTKKKKRRTEDVPQNFINDKQNMEDIFLSVGLKQLKELELVGTGNFNYPVIC